MPLKDAAAKFALKVKSATRCLDQNTINKMISERAYHIWESKGKPQDRDLENWAQAEKEIRAKLR